MANYGSEAYDLSLFEPKKAKITPLPNKKATKAERRRVKLQKLINGAATVLVTCCVVFVLAAMITSQVKLTETNNVISQAKSQDSELAGEIKRLEGELAAKTSAESVSEYADKNGFEPIQSGQIDYFTVTPAPIQTEQPEEETGFWASLWETLTGWIG
ncbi:MAG: hypothetical protein J6K62_03060 [Clostridia bacterium]|nr:hypothetical protein [Clostridia bacterium]